MREIHTERKRERGRETEGGRVLYVYTYIYIYIYIYIERERERERDRETGERRQKHERGEYTNHLLMDSVKHVKIVRDGYEKR